MGLPLPYDEDSPLKDAGSTRFTPLCDRLPNPLSFRAKREICCLPAQANTGYLVAFAPRNNNRGGGSFTGQELEDDLGGAVCRVLGCAFHDTLWWAQASFHLGQAFQHAVAHWAIGEDFPQSINNI